MSVMVKNKTNKNYKRSQRGRSMVEMLGMLAIMGVLSVGGVYGYSVAIKKYKANELLHQVSMRAVYISGMKQSDANYQPSVADFGNYGDYILTASNLGEDMFSINISGADIDEKVCKYMQIAAGENIQSFVSNPANCNGTVTSITLSYNNDLSRNCPGFSTPSSDGKSCISCSDLHRANGSYSGRCGGCVDGYTPDGDGNCIEGCGFKRWNGTGCFSCDTLESISGAGSQSDCLSCPNRELYNGNYCILKECPKGYFRGSLGRCISCADSGLQAAFTQEDCLKCSNRELRNAYDGDKGCQVRLASGQFKDYYGKVQNCNDVNAYGYVGVGSSSSDSCVACGNRYVTDAGWCALTECPKGYVRDDNDSMGECKSCDDEYGISMDEDASNECAKCSNRDFVNLDGSYYCAVKCSGGFYDYSGICYSCNTSSEPRYVPQSECERCGDTRYFVPGNDECLLKQ